MRKRIATLAGLTATVALVAAPHAAASTEIGSHCQGDTFGGNATQAQIANDPSDPLPAAAPSAGVVTKWSVNIAPLGFALPEKLKLLRPAASPNQLTVVGESRFEAVLPGPETFETRIPVQAGDHLGVYASSSSGALYCSGTGKLGDVYGSAAGDVTAGSTGSFLTSEGNQVAASATIEPDADGDGFGDETQDKCPQSAATQSPCPPITLEAFPIALKRSVLVLVSASETSSVHVFGQVSWRLRQKGGAHTSKTGPGHGKLIGLTVGLAGGTQTVKPGQLARFNVKLPKSVKRRLGRIPPSKSLKGTITARTTDITGRVTDRVINIHLKGQETNGH